MKDTLEIIGFGLLLLVLGIVSIAFIALLAMALASPLILMVWLTLTTVF